MRIVEIIGAAVARGSIVLGACALVVTAASAQSTTANVPTGIDSFGYQSSCDHIRRDASQGGRDVLVCDRNNPKELRKSWTAGIYGNPGGSDNEGLEGGGDAGEGDGGAGD